MISAFLTKAPSQVETVSPSLLKMGLIQHVAQQEPVRLLQMTAGWEMVILPRPTLPLASK